MSRDYRKLRVFATADELALRVYHVTRSLPSEERFGLGQQIRRAAVSTAANIVEGCARRSAREYGNFLNIAFASATEAQYLIRLAHKLHMIERSTFEEVDASYRELLGGLQMLIQAADKMARNDALGPEP